MVPSSLCSIAYENVTFQLRIFLRVPYRFGRHFARSSSSDGSIWKRKVTKRKGNPDSKSCVWRKIWIPSMSVTVVSLTICCIYPVSFVVWIRSWISHGCLIADFQRSYPTKQHHYPTSTPLETKRSATATNRLHSIPSFLLVNRTHILNHEPFRNRRICSGSFRKVLILPLWQNLSFPFLTFRNLFANMLKIFLRLKLTPFFTETNRKWIYHMRICIFTHFSLILNWSVKNVTNYTIMFCFSKTEILSFWFVSCITKLVARRRF